MIFWHALIQPVLAGFEIGFQASLRVSLEVGYVESVRRKLEHVCQHFPGVLDSLFLNLSE